MTTTIVQTVLHTIQQYKLIPPESRVVIGVSGGADSLALLHIFAELRDLLSYSLYAATFDHQLRDEAGAADVRFVQQIAGAWGIPVTIGQADVGALAREQGMGIEAAARQARYDFLADVARQVDAQYVAVAHHADDQAETVLMHILRGTGLRGLTGMALTSPLPQHPEITLIRPLLNVTRAAIDTYCADHNLEPRQDATNQDTTLLRNRIRRETLPQLRQINPQIENALTQLADIAAVEDDYMEQQVTTVMRTALTFTPKQVLIEREIFGDLHPALQRRLLYRAIARLMGRVYNLSYKLVLAAIKVGLQGQVGAVALLADGLQLRVDYATFVIEPQNAPIPTNLDLFLEQDTELVVQVPGVTATVGGWQLEASLAPSTNFQARLALPEGCTVLLRTRQDGDRFSPLGMPGQTKKVARWMIDRKLPQAIRDQIPLLMVDDRIAAILFGERWTVDEQWAVTEHTQRVVYFNVYNMH
jgi:tRNA(Ile)-lysidine synthase